jgi:hypothetical protein
MAMNSGQDASPDLPDAEAPDIDSDADTESLQRSRDAINQGHEAAREALKDDAEWSSGAREEPPGADEDAGARSDEESDEASER